MSDAVLHDSRLVAQAEIHAHAGTIKSYCAVIQEYAAVGDAGGLEHAVRHLALHTKIIIGELNALLSEEREGARAA